MTTGSSLQIRRAAFALAICASIPSAAPIKILFVNNSLTYFNDMPSLIDSLGKYADPPMDIHSDMHSIPGSELSQHCTPDCFSLIRSGGYDFVVLQGYLDTYYNPPAFYAAARVLDDSIRAAGAQTAFYMTWTWDAERNRFDTLAATYDSIGKELRAPVAPVGRIWEQLLQTLPQDQVYGDMVHPTGAMSYMAACVIFTTLTGRDPRGNAFDPVDTPWTMGSTWSCDTGGPALQRLAWETSRLYNGLPRPVFSPARATFWQPIDVSLSADFDSVTIRYTIDGTEPTSASAACATPLPVSATTTITAAVFRDGFRPSLPVARTYRKIDPPVLTGITVAPHSRWVLPNESRQFHAVGMDQYGDTMPARLIWRTTGGGLIDSTGLFMSNGAQDTFTITVSGPNDSAMRGFDIIVGAGVPLPSCHLTAMLALCDTAGAYYVPNSNGLQEDLIGEPTMVPFPGTLVTIYRAPYTWTWKVDPDGRWADDDRSWFITYLSVTIISQHDRMVRLMYRADGRVRFRCNGIIVEEMDTVLPSDVERMTPAFPLYQGRNVLLFKLQDFWSDNSIALRVVDSTGDSARGLFYLPEGEPGPTTGVAPTWEKGRAISLLRIRDFAVTQSILFDAKGRAVLRENNACIRRTAGRLLPRGTYYLQTYSQGRTVIKSVLIWKN